MAEAGEIAGARIDVHDRAGVPVVDVDCVFARVGRPCAVDLRRGAHRKDAQHRLDEGRPLEWLARDDRDEAAGAAGRVVQRVVRVTLDAEPVELGVEPEVFDESRRKAVVLLADDHFAGRAGDRVREILHDSAVEVEGAHVQPAGIRQVAGGDERAALESASSRCLRSVMWVAMPQTA